MYIRFTLFLSMFVLVFDKVIMFRNNNLKYYNCKSAKIITINVTKIKILKEVQISRHFHSEINFE